MTIILPRLFTRDAHDLLDESVKLLGIHYRAYRNNKPGAEVSRVYAANLCRDVAEQAAVLRERLLEEPAFTFTTEAPGLLGGTVRRG